jgi:hypothetical protein
MENFISIVPHARYGDCLHMFAQHMCIINSNGSIMGVGGSNKSSSKRKYIMFDNMRELIFLRWLKKQIK